MRSIPDQADLILGTLMLQDAQLRASGITPEDRLRAMKPGLVSLLSQFQDELLDAQRSAGVALATALNMAGGKRG